VNRASNALTFVYDKTIEGRSDRVPVKDVVGEIHRLFHRRTHHAELAFREVFDNGIEGSYKIFAHTEGG